MDSDQNRYNNNCIANRNRWLCIHPAKFVHLNSTFDTLISFLQQEYASGEDDNNKNNQMNEWMNAFSFEMNCYTLITVGELRVSGLAHVRGACALRKCPRDSPVRIFINITDISKKKNNNKHFIWLDVIITINGSWIAANSFAVINVRVYYCMRIPNHGWTYLLWLFIIESWTGKHTILYEYEYMLVDARKRWCMECAR